MVDTKATTKHVESPRDASVVVLTSTKKRKIKEGGASSKKQRQGKASSELCQLNLDVLHLIAEYVHPRDLLTLARTCKSLRELLMDKSSKFVWKAARGQVSGLPDCPADLTEPEYADLAFHARCHGCGKYAKKILWRMRRRYCSECKVTRLRLYSSCDPIVYQHHVIPVENISIKNEKGQWVDREQLKSFLRQYRRSSNKEQFLAERGDKLSVMSNHARDCERWEDAAASNRKYDLKLLRRQRQNDIFERLEQHGYGPEIAYHGLGPVYTCNTCLFKSAKPLTDKEWERMLPKWTEAMKPLRAQRLDWVVFQPRRKLLESEYDDYVKHPRTPVFDLLPNLSDLLEFPPFRDIIHGPEGTDLGPKPFESAFEQLPGLVDEWRKHLDIELAKLVKIPSSDQTSAAKAESSRLPSDKLRLACAVFEANCTTTRYPDVFSLMHDKNVSFWEPATHIVQACGLDPSVATVEDMDRRNARLKCLFCEDRYLRTWRNAIRHGRNCHRFSNCWEIVDDGRIYAIQAIERKDNRTPPLELTRCLLCRPRVGDAMPEYAIKSHLVNSHGIEPNELQQDVHFTTVYMQVRYCPVRIAEDGTLEESTVRVY